MYCNLSQVMKLCLTSHLSSNNFCPGSFCSLYPPHYALYCAESKATMLSWYNCFLAVGIDPGGGNWVASHPPLWGRLSLKLWKGKMLSLRWFCLWLFQYHSVRSATPPPLPFQKSWIHHWTVPQSCTQSQWLSCQWMVKRHQRLWGSQKIVVFWLA